MIAFNFSHFLVSRICQADSGRCDGGKTRDKFTRIGSRCTRKIRMELNYEISPPSCNFIAF